jgi:nucleoside-diphosphate-sugar epimerase
MRIFVAGASGAIGRRLIPLLLADGHVVTGTTRSADKAADLKASGAAPVVVDVFQAEALRRAVIDARPEVVVHQLTDLPQVRGSTLDIETAARNARLRIQGTANLLAAAEAAAVRRFIAQSIAFVYAEGPEPHAEGDPLVSGEGASPNAVTARGVRALEDSTLNTAGLDGIVLRYGRLYGPGTWFNEAHGPGSLHVDAAAHAALLAVTRGRPGIYNIAEDSTAITIEKACRELGFDPSFRLMDG